MANSEQPDHLFLAIVDGDAETGALGMMPGIELSVGQPVVQMTATPHSAGGAPSLHP